MSNMYVTTHEFDQIANSKTRKRERVRYPKAAFLKSSLTLVDPVTVLVKDGMTPVAVCWPPTTTGT